MGTNARRLAILAAVQLGLLLALSGAAVSDGGVIAITYDETFYLTENSQYAIIDHQGGNQGMLLSISLDWQTSDRSAWIFPVPSAPEELSLADISPTFEGHDAVADSRDMLEDAIETSAMLYAISAFSPYPCLGYVWVTSLADTGESVVAGNGVEVHEHIEAFGFTTEVVSAEEGLDLYAYLSGKGLNVTAGLVPPLDEYVRDDYSFIVTWVSAPVVTAIHPAVYVSFPANDLYYPLKLTSIYGEARIPTTIICSGHVDPKVPSRIGEYVEVDYYVDGEMHANERQSSGDVNMSVTLNDFLWDFRKDWDGKFTRIEIDAPSSLFTRDLWMERSLPWEEQVRLDYAAYLSEQYDDMCGVALGNFVVFSVVSGFLAGVIAHGKDDRKLLARCTALGFVNILGILFMIIVSYFVHRDYGMPKGSTRRFLLVYFALFVTLMWGTLLLMMLPLVV